MYKKVLMIILFIMFSFNPTMETAYSEEKNINVNKDILIVYDNGLSNDGQKNINSIVKVMVYLGYNVSSRNVDEAIEELKNYSHVIIYNERENMNNDFIMGLNSNKNKFLLIGGKSINQIIQTLKLPINYEKIENYAADINYKVSEEKEITGSIGVQNITLVSGKLDYVNGKVNVNNINGNYCVRSGDFTNISVYDENNDLLKTIFAKEIRLWMKGENATEEEYYKYIVFDEIYPFMSPDKLLKIVEMMKEQKVPYILSVMPIYNNGEYPAMKKFCEILTYAQANGATVILNYPIIQTEKMDKNEIQEKINIALMTYNKYGVYPVAFEVPDTWFYNETFLEMMKAFKSVIVKKDIKNQELISKENINISLSDHKIIGENDFNNIKLYDTAEYLDCNKDIEELKKQVGKMKQNNNVFGNLWSFSQEVYTDKEMLKYENNIIEVQGKEVSLNYIPYEYEEKFNYNRNVISNMVESMKKSNQVLLTIVLLTTIIFIGFILIARHKLHKKFFYEEDTSDE